MATSITVRSLSATQVAVGNRTTPFTISTSDLANDVKLRKQVAAAIEAAKVVAIGDNGQVFSADDVLNMGIALKDTREDYWEELAPFIGVGFPSANGAVSLDKGRVMIVGGDSGTVAKQDPWSQVYSNKLDTWTAVANPATLPPPELTDGHFGFVVTLKDGRVLASAGGIQTDQSDPGGYKCWIFNPATNVWTATGDRLTNNRDSGNLGDRQAGVLMKDGRVMLVGGRPFQSHQEYWDKTEIFNPAANNGVGAWSLGAPLPTPGGANCHVAWAQMVTLSDGRVLSVGGLEIEMDGDQVVDFQACPFVFAYNPKTNTWARMPDLLETHNSYDMLDYSTNPPTQLDADTSWAKYGASGRFYHAISLLPNNQVLAVGGQIAWAFNTFNCQIFDGKTNTWRHTDDLPFTTSVDILVATNSRGDVLVGGGQQSGPYYMRNSYTAIFDVVRESWEQSASLPLACVVNGVDAPFAEPTIENGGLFDPAFAYAPATDPNGNPYYYPIPAFEAGISCMISNNEFIQIGGYHDIYVNIPGEYEGYGFGYKSRSFKFTFGSDGRKKDVVYKKPHNDSVKAAAKKAEVDAKRLVIKNQH